MAVVTVSCTALAESDEASDNGIDAHVDRSNPTSNTVDDKSTASDDRRSKSQFSAEEIDAITYSAGYYNFSDAEWDVYLAALQEARTDQEDFTFTCMKSNGFEYFLVNDFGFAWKPQYSIEPDSKDWADIYGLGESTLIFHQDLLGNMATGYLGPKRSPLNLTESSPESIYLNGLSKEEYRAYQLALEGVDSRTIASDIAKLRDDALEHGGQVGELPIVNQSACRLQARERFPEPRTVPPEVQATSDRILASREWVEFVDNGWRCAKSSGVDGFSRLDVSGLIFQRQVELGMLDQRFSAISDDPKELPSDFVELLAQVQEYERELAADLWECGIHPIQERLQFATVVQNYVED